MMCRRFLATQEIDVGKWRYIHACFDFNEYYIFMIPYESSGTNSGDLSNQIFGTPRHNNGDTYTFHIVIDLCVLSPYSNSCIVLTLG